MQRINVKFILIILLGLLVLTNCEDILDESEVSPEDSAAALVLVSDANGLLFPLIENLIMVDPDSAQVILTGFDLSEPTGFYSEALELDWRNQDARFGVGFTSMLTLSQHISINDIFGQSVKVYAPFVDATSNPIGYGFGLPLSVPRVSGMVASYFELPLAFARLKFESLDAFNEFQTLAKDNYLPMLEVGLAALDSLDNNEEVTFSLGGEVELDIDDVLAMESSLYAMQGLLKGLTAYNYALDTSDPAAIIAGLSSGSTFGTRTDEGATLLAEAHSAAQMAIEKSLDALDYIVIGSPEADHLLLRFEGNDISQIQTQLNALTTTLSVATDIEYGYADERGVINLDGSASMSIDQYYLNSISDLKTLLPAYTMSTTTAYNYTQVTLNEEVNLEEAQVILDGLNNTPVSVNFMYSESTADTVAAVSLGFFSFNLLTANQGELPVAIWDLWAEFLVVIEDYTDEVHNFPEISFQWSGLVTTGSNLSINGNFSIDYLERTSEYTAPDILWTASAYDVWLGEWSNPTANGLFPDFLAEDLAGLMGIVWE